MDLRPLLSSSRRSANPRTCRSLSERLRPRLQRPVHAAPKPSVDVSARPEVKDDASHVQQSRQDTGAKASATPASSIDSLRSLRVVELQAQLRDLGLNKNGLKEVLVQRLHDALQEQHGQAPALAPVKLSRASPASSEPSRSRKADSKQGAGSSKQGGVEEKEGALGIKTQQRANSTTSSPAAGKQADVAGPKTSSSVALPVTADSRSSSNSGSSSSSSGSRRSGSAGDKSAGGNETGSRQKLLISSLISKLQTSADSQPQRKQEPAAAAAERWPSRQAAPPLSPEAAAAAAERRTGIFHPVSGHPQIPRRVSWSGHRPCRYRSVGKAKDVKFQESDRTMGSVRTLAQPPYPFIVGERGQYLDESPTPVSEWVDQPPPPEDLPPFPLSLRRESYGSHELNLGWAEKEEIVLGNSTGLNLSFLGTSSDQSTRHRAQPSVALVRAKDVVLIDAGDDTQRQIARMSTVRVHKVYRIFITCLSADCILGLPGLLCSISSSRERGHEIADIPVHIYGPPGLTDFLDTMLKVSNTYIEVSIVVHEFTMKPVPPEQAAPICVNERSRLWMVLMPPDQLNPQGFIEGDLSSFMPNQGRATILKGSSFGGGVLGTDPRANFLPFPDPVPGLPTRTDVAPLDMRWTIRMDSEGIMTALPLTASRPTMAYVFLEADRVGNLMMERAHALGVPKGAAYGMLKEGRAIVIPGGRLVTPEMVISPPRMGRKVVFMGTCSDSSSLLRHPEARSPDVLVAGCIRPASEAVPSAVKARVLDPSSRVRDLLTAEALGRTAAQLGARHVLLSRFNWRLHGGDAHPYDDPVLEQLVKQVAGKLSLRQRVSAVHDLWVHVLEKHDGVCFPDAPLVQAEDGMLGDW